MTQTYRRFTDPPGVEVHWYLWVPDPDDGPDQAVGIFGLNPKCAFFLNRNRYRWESDPWLFDSAFGAGSDPKIRVNRSTAEKVARRFGSDLPDVKHGWPPRSQSFPP